MCKKSLMELEEQGGERFPDLETAQRAALPYLVRELAEALRMFLAAGDFIIQEGKVVINPEKEVKL